MMIMSRYKIPEAYSVLRAFSRLCQYMYRKGVRDSAELFSPEMSQKFLDENDPITDFVFMFDEDGKKLKFEFYCALCSMYLIKISARKGLVLLNPEQATKPLRMGAACLVNAYYRKGVKEGVGIDMNVALDFFHSNKSCTKHIDIKGKVFKTMDFIEDMRSEALRLESNDCNAGHTVWKFICDGLTEYYIERENG